ncbi:MAG: hypothetical protein HC897_19955 [Thermoanaerobaculia bacterium]|nr:hypothetical protein [Thermoanaerobaculia bacterium]
MKRQNLTRLAMLGLILALVIVASALTAAGPEACNLYYNSRPGWVTNFGPVCWSSGGSCRECYGPGGSPTCVEDGGGSGCLAYQQY